MSNKFVEMLTHYRTGSVIDASTLGLSGYESSELIRVVRNKMNCVSIIQRGNRGQPTLIQRLFSRRDGADRQLCANCPAISTCSDFLGADAREAQNELPDFSFHEIHNDFTY